MKMKHVKNNTNNIPILSFFTGGGFLDMGFEQAGFNIVWTNESNPVFAKMYSSGITSWRNSVFQDKKIAEISDIRDVEKIPISNILKNVSPEENLDFFGVIGGPPCPDFSSSGKHGGGTGINGRLSLIYIQKICGIMPSFFIFENVSGLYRIKAHRKFLYDLESKLERKDFCLDLKILNALEFGVPQNRERLIMIGINKSIVRKCLNRHVDVSERGWFPWPKPIYKDAKSEYTWPDIETNRKTPYRPPNIPLDLCVYSILNNKNNPSKLPNGSDYFKPHSSKFSNILEGDTKRKSFKRLHRYRYSPTVCYGHNEVHLHPWKKRRLSVREAMRIQGIPDEYVLPKNVPLSDKFTLVSNGVPVPLANAIATSLKDFFIKKPF